MRRGLPKAMLCPSIVRSEPGRICLANVDRPLKQLTAEQLVTVKNKRGFAKLEWQKLRERNEALDCRVYARAAAWILGADRWSDARWEELAAQFAVADGRGTASATGPQSLRKAQVRRVARSTYMG